MQSPVMKNSDPQTEFSSQYEAHDLLRYILVPYIPPMYSFKANIMHFIYNEKRKFSLERKINFQKGIVTVKNNRTE